MTYCDQPDWPSPYTYNAVFERLKAESALNIPAGAPLASLGRPLPQSVGPSTAGPPAIAPTQSVGPDANSQKAAVPVGYVAVQAIVNLSKGSATFKYINQSLRGPTSTKPPAAGKPSAQLKFIDDKGTTITSYKVPVNPASDTPPGGDKLGLVNATIPEPAAASKIQLWFNDKLSDGRDIFEVKPLVHKAASTGGPGSPLSIQWNFVNADPAARVSYDVQTSQNGYIWSTFMVGLRDNHLTLTPELAKIPYFRVIANDGVHDSDPVIVKRPSR
jgi:hypothetical protein